MKYLACLNLHNEGTETTYLSLNSSSEPCMTSSIKKAYMADTSKEILDMIKTSRKTFGELELIFTDPDVPDEQLESDMKEEFISWKATEGYEEYNSRKLNLENMRKIDYSNIDNVIMALREAYFACDYCVSCKSSASDNCSSIDKSISELEHIFESDNLKESEVYATYLEFQKLRKARRTEKKLYAIGDLIEKHVDLKAMAAFVVYLEYYSQYRCYPDSNESAKKQLEGIKKSNVSSKKL